MKNYLAVLTLLALTACSAADSDVPADFGRAYNGAPVQGPGLSSGSKTAGSCPDPNYIKFDLSDELGRKLAWNTSKRLAAQGCPYNPY